MIERSLRHIPDDWLNPMPVAELFPKRQPVEVDLGFGKGRFLLARAKDHPATNFLGIDRMLERVRKVDNRARRMDLHNVRLVRVEGFYAVSYLIPPAAVSAYYIFFPDPWPKKRHHDNRMFNRQFVDALHRTLTPGGCVHVATDHLPYFDAIREIMRSDPRFGEIEPFVPAEHERTDFELWYLDKGPIGRWSGRRHV